MDRSDIRDNIIRLRREVYMTAANVGRSPSGIKIVAVTKNVPVEAILIALEE